MESDVVEDVHGDVGDERWQYQSCSNGDDDDKRRRKYSWMNNGDSEVSEELIQTVKRNVEKRMKDDEVGKKGIRE